MTAQQRKTLSRGIDHFGSLDLTPGLYETLVTSILQRSIDRLGDRASEGDLVGAEAATRLADHLARVVERVLAGHSPAEQVALVNTLLDALAAERGTKGEDVVLPPKILQAVLAPESAGLGVRRAPDRPSTPLAHDSLLVNSPSEPNLAGELRKEIGSADAIDLLSAFIVWTGVRAVGDELLNARTRGVRVRVITSTYTGVTDVKALDALVEMGCEVRVSYEVGATRLHAKAWLFERNSGFATAYVGSSNLTHTAIHDGVEWNVRLTQHSSASLLDRFRATFETYWADERFEPYEREKFVRAVTSVRQDHALPLAMLEVRPLDYQARMLERLAVERDRFDRHRNLVVAATGTGKTVLAALDYARLAREWKGARLLFVAHRKEILDQSLATFHAVMRDGSFGELLVGDQRPASGDHVFASVQSLANVNLVQDVPPDHYDVVIVDEFHHAAAPTYRRLLEHVRPRELLGLTATPERADLQDITAWFGHHISAELRLWEAIDYGYLCPFQYFGVADGKDLSAIEFKRGRYNVDDLDALYTGDDARQFGP